MNICLKTYAKQTGRQQVITSIQQRLPDRISPPCELICDFQVDAQTDYYLVTLDVRSELVITCQRCLGQFQHVYNNHTELAVCSDEAMAERLMGRFESIVAPNCEIDLTDVLTDELYLFSPEKHLDYADCDQAISRLINEKA